MLRLVVVLLTVLLAACSSRPVQLYAGPAQTADKIATIRVPVELQVLSLNGKKVEGAHTLLGTKDQQLQLLPGHYQLLVFYNNIWQTSADEHETVKSDPVKLDLTLAAGHHYQVDFERAKTARDAEAFRQHFHIWAIDLSSGAQTASTDSGLKLGNSIYNQLTGQVTTVAVGAADANGNQVIAPLAPVTTTASTNAPTATSASGAGYLDLLKAQWSQASSDEKRAFLQWISAHP